MTRLKDKLLARKVEKHRALVRQAIQQHGGSDRMFQALAIRPSQEQAEAMFVAGKFGGIDPLSAGGGDFAQAYICDEFTVARRQVREKMREGGTAGREPLGPP